MRLESVFVIPCLCGASVESNSPTVQHFCADLNPVIEGAVCPWPRRYRELVVKN